MKKDDLIRLIDSLHGRITTKVAREAGFSSSMLQLLVSQGVLVAETRGVFALADIALDDYAVMALRWPKITFSHSSALFLHGMIDLVPGFIEISLPQGYKPDGILNEFPGALVHHENKGLFSLGVQEGASPTGTALLLHDRERSICDLVQDRKGGVADTQILSAAMNAYFSRKYLWHDEKTEQHEAPGRRYTPRVRQLAEKALGNAHAHGERHRGIHDARRRCEGQQRNKDALG